MYNLIRARNCVTLYNDDRCILQYRNIDKNMMVYDIVLYDRLRLVPGVVNKITYINYKINKDRTKTCKYKCIKEFKIVLIRYV